MPFTVSVILGSIRPGRQGIRAAKHIQGVLESQGANVHFIDPEVLNLPLFAVRYDYTPAEHRTPALNEVFAKFTESDAFVIVTPEYNHAYSPVISSLMNYFYHDEYYYKVAGIASYSMGPFGGQRGAIQLRPYLGELGLVSIPKLLAYPIIQALLNEDGTVLSGAAGAGSIAESSSAFVTELLWYAKALKTAVAGGKPIN
ncbi:NADPH-dependent FMN reductase [Thraustotheca clavata]|uniref:NADPH-dependent FMN reductase n=1 Tax=Thraustotheca clavata TaxID=74557 RepID=A0A1V9ZMV4_9STRA|nr:NADPH-dependent FMN reductase [Thraustotheca clavata]